MARILAIDFGSKRVGLAVTDPMQIIATALTTVDRKEALEYISQYI
ncbi:MAG: Holliday junction resolvase RuvX, partial [Chitinophagales bacterium]